MAITMPFAIGLFNGFEGAHYGTLERFVVFFSCVFCAALAFFVARRNILALAIMVVIYLVMAVSSNSVLWVGLLYVLLTSLPYGLALVESYSSKTLNKRL